jgi:outer membrane protein
MIVSTVLVTAASGGVGWGGEVKIAFVDLQRALGESNAGKAARERFVNEMERLQAKLRKEKEELDDLREEFDKKAMLLREEERQNKEQALEDKNLEFKRKYEDYQRELKRTDNEYTGAILRELQVVIRDVAQRQGYTLVLEAQSSGILYGNPEADLTDEILREYNAGK